jgi:hypothetical protein
MDVVRGAARGLHRTLGSVRDAQGCSGGRVARETAHRAVATTTADRARFEAHGFVPNLLSGRLLGGVWVAHPDAFTYGGDCRNSPKCTPAGGSGSGSWSFSGRCVPKLELGPPGRGGGGQDWSAELAGCRGRGGERRGGAQCAHSSRNSGARRWIRPEVVLSRCIYLRRRFPKFPKCSSAGGSGLRSGASRAGACPTWSLGGAGAGWLSWRGGDRRRGAHCAQRAHSSRNSGARRWIRPEVVHLPMHLPTETIAKIPEMQAHRAVQDSGSWSFSRRCVPNLELGHEGKAAGLDGGAELDGCRGRGGDRRRGARCAQRAHSSRNSGVRGWIKPEVVLSRCIYLRRGLPKFPKCSPSGGSRSGSWSFSRKCVPTWSSGTRGGRRGLHGPRRLGENNAESSRNSCFYGWINAPFGDSPQGSFRWHASAKAPQDQHGTRGLGVLHCLS